MGMLRTLGRVFAGFILACIAAGLVQVLFVETPKELAAIPVSQYSGQARSTLELSLLTATHFAIFSAAFALIAAGIAEWLSLRGPGYWLAAGTGIALLGYVAQYASEVAGQPSILNNYALQAYLTAGFFGGLVYWLVAGAKSGAGHVSGDAVAITAQPAPRARVVVEKPAPGEVKKGSLAEKLALKRNKLTPVGQTPSDADAATPATAQTASGPATAVPVTKPEGAAKQPKAKASTGNAPSSSASEA